ncbi:DUF433 domain-containing protein [Lacihabitans soyangensis]|jgi:uncharacterized protein (DUF433 family)|uniref:DUF433 domain-containing protein n=1 Tax=Lacihabitans soyangensis TaxID=869394 RepID=A0AAE3H6F0_9BACT|nr:DUF433 domain-containing protein [Lacihabitans soyangensis]MCP9765707.1 DUF433 domain-containing protein [Lacihabitans soyangensis]
MDNYLERITLDKEICGGKPTIRKMRFTVSQMLELLASGMSHSEVLKDYPFLQEEDIQACLQFAAQIANAKSLIPSHAA